MLIISSHEQGTPEWFADRLGKATGSNASAITAKGKTKGTEATTRRNYRFQLALERITGKPTEPMYKNAHMERGNELEKFARMAHEIETGEMVEEAGFCYQNGTMFGCSVDGFLQNREGIGEYKCPLPAIHYGYIQENKVPNEYKGQVIHNLLTTGAKFCDFGSYCETMPEKLKFFLVRYEPTQAELDEYQDELNQFLVDVDLLVQEIQLKAA